MGDNCLRCLDCQGKFGAICSDLRCALCGTLFRLKGLVLSETFPAGAGHFAEVSLRDVYFKVLEAGEAKAAEEEVRGGEKKDPPGSIDKSPLDDTARRLQTTPKAKPAVKGGGVEEEGVKEESPVEEKSPKERAESSHRREEKPKHKKKRRPKSEEEEEVKAKKKKRRSRTSGRSRSRTLRGKQEERIEERPPLQRNPERKERDRSRGSRDRPRGEREPEGRSLRPRSPVGPPPPRSPQRRWSGPIPARPREYHQSWERRPENKGVKKKRQQALFAEFKLWRQNYRGGRYY